jgi:hypothetical protein
MSRRSINEIKTHIQKPLTLNGVPSNPIEKLHKYKDLGLIGRGKCIEAFFFPFSEIEESQAGQEKNALLLNNGIFSFGDLLIMVNCESVSISSPASADPMNDRRFPEQHIYQIFSKVIDIYRVNPDLYKEYMNQMLSVYSQLPFDSSVPDYYRQNAFVFTLKHLYPHLVTNSELFSLPEQLEITKKIGDFFTDYLMIYNQFQRNDIDTYVLSVARRRMEEEYMRLDITNAIKGNNVSPNQMLKHLRNSEGNFWRPFLDEEIISLILLYKSALPNKQIPSYISPISHPLSV